MKLVRSDNYRNQQNTKIVTYELSYDYAKPKYGQRDELVTWIQDLILQIMNQTDHYLKEKIKYKNGSMENDLGGKIMVKFAALRPKACSSLTSNNEEKKTKGTKK